MNETLDPSLKSWVETANDPLTDFPIQNLPFGIFRRLGTRDAGRIGVAIGDQILDLATAEGSEPQASLNALMGRGSEFHRSLRLQISRWLRVASTDRERLAAALTPMEDCKMLLPAQIGDYTDFYASEQHATNVGRLFRPDNPLLPNYKYVPIAYHGRASSVVVSDSPIAWPSGQTKPTDQPPQFGPSQRVDYEVELGFYIGAGNALGTPVPVGEAGDRVFGFSLVNDWSARDVQAWEYQPLGPFLGKSFGTTVSPWVVTTEALSAFRTAAYARPEGDPKPLAYLTDANDQAKGGLDINLEVWIETDAMRQTRVKPVRLSRGNFRDMYWTVAQMVAHHTSNGCNLRTGDLIASGTVSAEAPDSRGCLLELTRGGAEPIQLPTGETRKFLEDGDEIILRGRCEKDGLVPIGFGECRGRVTSKPW